MNLPVIIPRCLSPAIFNEAMILLVVVFRDNRTTDIKAISLRGSWRKMAARKDLWIRVVILRERLSRNAVKNRM